MRKGTPLVLVCVSAALGCEPDLPPKPAPAPTAPWQRAPVQPVPVQPVQPALEVAAQERCEVELSLEVRELSEQVRAVSVLAFNKTQHVLNFEIPERCPNGAVELEGLGAGYDYYGTCRSGACAGFPPMRRVMLPPGQPQPLAEAHLRLDGAPPCTQPLPQGQYTLRPVAPKSSVRICTRPSTLVVRGPEAPLDPHDPYACNAPGDCVLSCPQAAGCCGYPCGCNHAIARTHRERFEANYAKTCQRVPHCPAMGCAYQPARAATCRHHRCVAVDGTGAW